MNFEKVGFLPADILLPENADMKKWSVVACDQYTSQEDYWQSVRECVGDAPSTYNMIFPEIYLEKVNSEEKIKNINEYMQKYLDDGVFKTLENSFVYVERGVSTGKVRKGLVGMVDLDMYDYNKGAKTLIRATEGTVLERIPPRVKIRINAPLELPHIMILVDDKKNLLFESVEKNKGEVVYDFDLMQGSGHIKGTKVEPCEDIYLALESLYEACDKENPLLYAMGDGNHSLATAKKCWMEISKDLSEEEKKNHPARYALAEIVNIHDESLEFEPIHRVLFDCGVENVIDKMKKYYDVSETFCEGSQEICYVENGEKKIVYVKNPKSYLPVGTLQMFIDSELSDVKVDYIHGEDVVLKLSSGNNIGFILPPMDKSDLFKTVMSDGALPRKTFSMGEACDKRFYIECRKTR